MNNLISPLRLLVLVTFIASCQSVDKLAERGKFERLVWFDPESKELLRFHKGYVQLTRLDSTGEKPQIRDDYYPYTFDAGLQVISYNSKNISLAENGDQGWRLEKYEPIDLAIDSLPTQNLKAEAQDSEARKEIQVMGSVNSVKENEPLSARVIFKSVEDLSRHQEYQTDSTGQYSIHLHREAYRVTAEVAGYVSEDQYIDLSPEAIGNSLLSSLHMKPLRMVPLEEGSILSLGITFAHKKSAIQPSVMQELLRLAQTLKDFPTLIVEVRGHTDNTGSPSINMMLSTQRANAVRDFLVVQGIAPTRVQAKGYGETKPLVSNDEEEEGRALNRRVDVRIVGF